jgi:hypothetical protein
MASNDAVFQRRNKQIQDAIDGQNLKQALNLIEKRMKKGEDTVFLKVFPPVPFHACCIGHLCHCEIDPTTMLLKWF